MGEKSDTKLTLRKRLPYDEKKGTPVTWFTQWAKILQEMLTECGMNEMLATRLSTFEGLAELYVERFKQKTLKEISRFEVPVSGIPVTGFDKMIDIEKQPLEIRLRDQVREILDRRAGRSGAAHTEKSKLSDGLGKTPSKSTKKERVKSEGVRGTALTANPN